MTKQKHLRPDNYLFIQKYRFGDKIEIRYYSDEVLNFYIPSFYHSAGYRNSIARWSGRTDWKKE